MGQRSCQLRGERFELMRGQTGYPQAFGILARPPACLYGVGDVHALREGLAVVGARKATPYGLSCARRFARLAARKGVVIISGGARGCDAVAHEAALEAGAPTVVFLGGGCDRLYPAEHASLFQRVVDGGGAVVSEHAWDFDPVPYAFRERNRLIASLARATLIVEAGLPSGTFSTADEALAANREVLVVPGAITSASSRGANRLLYQGATPVVDDETFEDQLFSLFGCLRSSEAGEGASANASDVRARVRAGRASGAEACERVLLEALRAEPLGIEALRGIVEQTRAEKGAEGDARAGSVVGNRADVGVGEPVSALTWLMVWLAKAQRDGLVAQYPDGRYGPVLRC